MAFPTQTQVSPAPPKKVWRLVNKPYWILQLQFEPRDVWVGLFWRTTQTCFHFYICLLPLLPLHLTVVRKSARDRSAYDF